jgi:uncharacterized protein with HEPN domain
MKSDRVFLGHILESADKIEEYTEHITREDFGKNNLVFDEVVRQIMIIGEASVNLTDAFKETHYNIPWHKIIGMRNELVHGYFGLDVDTVWETSQVDVPELRKYIKPLL